MHNTPRQNQTLAYTLIELLVVIAIMVVSIAIIVPSINKFVESTYKSSGKNALSAAVSTIRAYATRPLDFDSVAIPNAIYDGTAVIITPSSRVRLVENIQYAIADTKDYMETILLNGYADLADVEDVVLPKDTGIVGINAPSGSDQFICPPFAIHFDAKGYLALSDPSDTKSYVYYDSNLNSRFQFTSGSSGCDRAHPYYTSDSGGDYNVNDWDRWSPEYAVAVDDTNPSKPGYNSTRKRYRLPFEKLEAVAGIIVYSKRELREDGGVFPDVLTKTYNATKSGCGPANNQGCNTFSAWLKNHGEVMFFSRYSGASLK